MGRILHSTNACINIINHISKEMKNILVCKIISFKSKMSLIIDEATTISQKSALILYIRVLISGCEMTAPVSLFSNLIESDDVTLTGIFSSLICHLHSITVTEEYLNDYLVSVACDGAVVMFGSRGRVNRLELAVHDAVKTVSGINRFKSFIDKLYVLYHASPKNCRELITSLC
jgi:hypothetical protein